MHSGRVEIYCPLCRDPRLQRVAAQVTLKKLVLVYSGWELVYRAEVDGVAGEDTADYTILSE
jgi:hypothetical protein